MALKPLTHPVQLLAEGGMTKGFAEAHLNHLARNDVQVHDFGGIKQLRPVLKGLVAAPGFQDLVTTVAVIRDAEVDASAAFQSACDALANASLPVPATPNVIETDGQVRTSIFILPDGVAPGMLETLCLRSVGNDPAMPCIQQFLQCLTAAGVQPSSNPAKAQVQAFLATRPQFASSVAVAANLGYWDWQQHDVQVLGQFLQAL